MISFAGLVWLRKSSIKHLLDDEDTKATVAVPPIWSSPTEAESPWRLQPKNEKQNNVSDDDKRPHARSTSIIAFILLTFAYFSTGRFSLFFENGLYAAAGYGLPLTVAMHRSLVVLLGHLSWVAVGSAILAGVLSPKPFFGGGWTNHTSKTKTKKSLRPYRWYTNKWDTYWLWWTIGGYFVSAWLFNIADFANQVLLPAELFAEQSEGVVSQLINPENNDFLASLVGYIAPCLSAPWWEEVLYRGYLLPALGLFMGFWPSVFVSGVLFSVHHLSVMGAIPLAVLGWVWAVLYAKSGNILVTILIHGMWNSRVFLGSWLGL
jgi:membrane protease YdiL (CAAX protease family)